VIAHLALLLALTAAADGAVPCPAVLVSGVGTPEADLLRSAAALGAPELAPGVVRRGGAHLRCGDGAALPWALPRGDAGPGSPSARVLPFRLQTALNTGYPSGANDGLLWAGRGVSGLASAGVALRWRFLSAAVAPEVAGAFNEPFRTVPVDPARGTRFSNPFYGDGIDLPQRFGASPLATWSPGQSYVRADVWNVGFGVSTENLWFGPGVRNSLTMSNAGPGFPHVFVGTTRPGDVGIGRAEAFAFWGRLARSDEFRDEGRPLISGLVLGFSPGFEPGLTVGLARVFVQGWDLSARTLLAAVQPFSKASLPGDNPDDNQLVSLFARWVLPASGFEVHAEWGREDHEMDIGDTIREPDHSQAYLLGLEKVWRTGARRVRLQLELTHLQEQRPLGNERGVPVWYAHGGNLGHTHRGQLLGAWIGPGADSQTLAVDVFSAGGRIGVFLERVRRNDGYYWAVIEPLPRGTHDVELGGGLRGVHFWRGVELTWEAGASKRWSRDFLRSEWNGRVAVGAAVPLGRAAP
jgi:hypothetical protein